MWFTWNRGGVLRSLGNRLHLFGWRRHWLVDEMKKEKQPAFIYSFDALLRSVCSFPKKSFLRYAPRAA